jgi:hypothetical protein
MQYRIACCIGECQVHAVIKLTMHKNENKSALSNIYILLFVSHLISKYLPNIRRTGTKVASAFSITVAINNIKKDDFYISLWIIIDL